MDNKLQKATILFGLENMEIFNRSKKLKSIIKKYEERAWKKVGN